MDAEVTVKFVIYDVCEHSDLKDDYFSLEDAVQDVINEEGLGNLLDDAIETDVQIVEVRPIG